MPMIGSNQPTRMPSPDTFHEDETAVLFFSRILDEIGAFTETSNVIDYFAQPYKWKNEYGRWISVNAPVDRNVLLHYATFIVSGLTEDGEV